MIKNTNEILTQNIEKAECILKEFMKDVLKQEQDGKLTINTMEKTLGKMFASLIQMGLGMAGALLSNIAIEKMKMVEEKKINNLPKGLEICTHI